MTENERIEREIEKTLQCFDDLETIAPKPFFFTRLNAKIRGFEKEKAHTTQQGWNWGSLRPALLSLLIVLNLISAVAIFRGTETQADSRGEYLDAFAEEYSFTQETEDLFSFVN